MGFVAGLVLGILVGFGVAFLAASFGEPLPPEPCIGQKWRLDGVGLVTVCNVAVERRYVRWVSYEWTEGGLKRSGIMHISAWQCYATPS